MTDIQKELFAGLDGFADPRHHHVESFRQVSELIGSLFGNTVFKVTGTHPVNPLGKPVHRF